MAEMQTVEIAEQQDRTTQFVRQGTGAVMDDRSLHNEAVLIHGKPCQPSVAYQSITSDTGMQSAYFLCMS